MIALDDSSLRLSADKTLSTVLISIEPCASPGFNELRQAGSWSRFDEQLKLDR
jgi:hypothetical protein